MQKFTKILKLLKNLAAGFCCVACKCNIPYLVCNFLYCFEQVSHSDIIRLFFNKNSCLMLLDMSLVKVKFIFCYKTTSELDSFFVFWSRLIWKISGKCLGDILHTLSLYLCTRHLI